MRYPSVFQWVVIGAGPAGIIAVGKLLDNGIDPKEILWVDPVFCCGDLGLNWKHVSSNTRVKLFLKFYASCQAFQYDTSSRDFEINGIDPDQTCSLELVALPLQFITDNLRKTVTSIQDTAIHLKLHQRQWEISLSKMEAVYAKNVVLAIGAEPKSLLFPQIEEVSLKTALDPQKLRKAVNSEDTVAVFGSSHSAMVVLKTLLEECDVKKVINFYQSPLRYAVSFSDWTLFDDIGLKGNTAIWARENIDGTWPVKLERFFSNDSVLNELLPLCQKAIYAIGFEKRKISVEGLQSLDYNDKNGIIAPGLFGFGIGFPESKVDPLGSVGYRVGLWKFMEYITRIMPVWLKYGV